MGSREGGPERFFYLKNVKGHRFQVVVLGIIVHDAQLGVEEREKKGVSGGVRQPRLA